MTVRSAVENLIGFDKALAAGERVDVEGDVLLWHAAHDTADKPAAREDIELSELLRRLDGVSQRQHVSDHTHLHAFSSHDERSGQHSAGRIDVEVGEMVLIDQGAVKPKILTEGPLVEVLPVCLGGQLGAAESIGKSGLWANVVRNVRVGRLVKSIKLHLTHPPRR
jgi:hypothetical protein